MKSTVVAAASVSMLAWV